MFYGRQSSFGRYELLPSDDRATSFLLGDLLAVQDGLSTEESAFVESQISYAISLAQRKRVTGMLLQYELME